jgi:hypothetical protein
MKLRITVDVFSGRENPVIELSGKKAADALDRLRPTRALEKGEPGLPAEPTLGYRGLIVEQVGDTVAETIPKSFRFAHGDMFGAAVAQRVSDESFEDFICGSTGPIKEKFGAELAKTIHDSIPAFHSLRRDKISSLGVFGVSPPLPPFPPKPKVSPCTCGPFYEPAWWNVPAIQPYNNCYNYSTDYRTNTFAQPGKSASHQYTALTCASVKPAAVWDCLIDAPNANNTCPTHGHLVALVIWPNTDYHWYRKDQNGLWSHKPGGTPVTNLDSSGHLITDPRTANRGGYTVFCTFMNVMHGHIKIS